MSTSWEVQKPPSNIPPAVIFINGGNAVLMATSKGYACIFESKHGKHIQSLKHGNGKTRFGSSSSFLTTCRCLDQTWITALVRLLVDLSLFLNLKRCAQAYAGRPGHGQWIATGDGNCQERTKIKIWCNNDNESSSAGWKSLWEYVRFQPVRYLRM